ncbi:glutathione-dependent formaldehyde-activating enzyme [Annulohypoxylon maeteangense]|uniref:glutathione-dependent formaldehyde-activating enzyme n=1 Tax=Annulohypoxylon maeteangense TaxID=1927788 RepID=UPI0020075B12|nr:glutathione-dependent formaldehyde-activating enzyme [Annulohypoxylon maeteangense]KAI0888927.1 glutathione-dependent formaldehyde-activating enzyme [Annulohypoxylon maeteangense]
MAETLKTFRGSCHCGEYIYEVDLPEKFKPTECNCSSCYKKGALWIMPEPGKFRFVKGNVDTLTNYTFGEKTFNHKFCPNCGVHLLIVGYVELPKPGEVKDPMTGFNVRSFQYGQGVDVWTIERNHLDGKSFRAPYELPKFTGPEPTAVIEGGRLYNGSCHCGAIKVALKSKPLDKSSSERILECNCSICNRHGSVWSYPQKDQIVIEGEDNLGVYLFNTKLFGKTFCKTCGIAVHNHVLPISEEQFNQMPEAMQKFVESSKSVKPINLRLFNDLNVRDLNVGQFDGYNQTLPRYVEP